MRSMRKRKKVGACAVQFLFNTKSFAHTIENLFHFSFLIKKVNAGVKALEDEDNKVTPMVVVVSNQDATSPQRKCIISLNLSQ